MSQAKRREHINIEFEDDDSKNKAGSSAVHTPIYQLNDIAVIPAKGDNCSIVTRKVDQGTLVVFPNQDKPTPLPFTILEAHRLCAFPIKKGEPLLSWGLPFGFATRDIFPGEYIMNESMLENLKIRNLEFTLPSDTNFEDRLESLRLDVSKFTPRSPTVKLEKPILHFNGYVREGERGVGTRNMIVILGLTSLVSSYVRLLEEEIKGKESSKVVAKIELENFPNIDGITSVSHTEGGTRLTPINNLHFIMRALGGWVVHPNVGGILIVADETDVAFSSTTTTPGSTLLTLSNFTQFLKENNYPLEHTPHKILSLSGNFKYDLKDGLDKIKELLPIANKYPRESVPVSFLKIAMQCGGSDAFSGVSANPLAGWAVKEFIKNGGSANLAETDELMGAEPYIVESCPKLEIAEKFLQKVEWFKNYAGWHGHTAETNPSGGNKYRGLYNIALKSLGAAMKKNPEVSLDSVIDYAERMSTPGYYFMNSPGNDLESIAGQVASGCNLIYFTTGNGSVTNFPFVPTIKIVTTSGRFRLLSKDMDLNAGEYLDGTPIDVLGKKLVDYTIEVANGKRSIGEKAGHSQVSIWRNWLQVDSTKLSTLSERPETLSGVSLLSEKKISPERSLFSNLTWKGLYDSTKHRFVTNHIGLILPTSLCSSQVARQITTKLNQFWEENCDPVQKSVVSYFVALPHTEGCGSSPGLNEIMFRRTMLGHLVHPSVRYGLLLEHGCEKTHNDYMSLQLKTMGVSLAQFGWASVQLDGGIESVTKKVMQWFHDKITHDVAQPSKIDNVGLGQLRLAIILPPNSKVSNTMAKALGLIVSNVVDEGGLIVIPQNSPLLQTWTFLTTIDKSGSIQTPITPTLGYGQTPLSLHGLHIMQTVTDHHIENLTGLGSSGVEIALYISENEHKTVQTHPFIPLPQITTSLKRKPSSSSSHISNIDDFDIVIEDENGEDFEGKDVQWAKQIMELVVKIASREYTPKLSVNSDFQIARDSLAIST